MDGSSENTALTNYFDNTEMIENSKAENSRDTSMAEKEIIACPSIAGEIRDNSVVFINDFDKEEVKDKNTGASSMFEIHDSHPSTVDEVISGPVAFSSNSDDVEMTGIFKIKESSDSPTAEREIIAGSSTASETVSNTIAFVNNSDNVETKDKRVEISSIGISSMSETEIVAGPSAIGEAFKRTAFKQKATKEGVKKAIALRSRVPLMVITALDKCDKTDGMSLSEIKAYIGEKYKCHVDVLKSQINDYIKKCEERGVFVKIRGANGAYKYKIRRVIINEESASTET